MLTGDNRTTALAVAKRLGIAEVEAEVLPDQKSAVIEKLAREGRVVAMAGDGVNDAPALAAAEVGIAMGTGTDVAIESAGITLLKGDLNGIVKARALSKAVMRNIRQNLFFAFIYNSAGVPIAAGVLYPAFGLLLSPIIAAAAMALSSVSVVGNALRLRRVKLVRTIFANASCRARLPGGNARSAPPPKLPNGACSASTCRRALSPSKPSAAKVRARRRRAVVRRRTAAAKCRSLHRRPGEAETPEGALPDGRVATGTHDIARAWLADPTERYDHGILGDTIESGRLMIEMRDGKRHTVRLKNNAVFEDLGRALADLDGDGHDEIIVVKSYLSARLGPRRHRPTQRTIRDRRRDTAARRPASLARSRRHRRLHRRRQNRHRAGAPAARDRRARIVGGDGHAQTRS